MAPNSGLGAVPAPAFPIDKQYFGPFGQMLQSYADDVSAPVDYVAMSMLAAVASLIGPKRRARASSTRRWVEPCILWIGVVGGASSGKSPALDIVGAMLGDLEKTYRAEHQLQRDNCLVV